MDARRGTLKTLLEENDVQYEAGVHSRWLFHGAGSADALEAIIDNPVSGFAPQMARVNLWGYGLLHCHEVGPSAE